MSATMVRGWCDGGIPEKTSPFLLPGSGQDMLRGRRIAPGGKCDPSCRSAALPAPVTGGADRSGGVVGVVCGKERAAVEGGVSMISSCSCSSERTGRLPPILFNGGWRVSELGGTMMRLSSGSSVSVVGDVGTRAPFSETVKLMAPPVAGADWGTPLLDEAVLLEPEAVENDAERPDLPFGFPPSEDGPEPGAADGLGG